MGKGGEGGKKVVMGGRKELRDRRGGRGKGGDSNPLMHVWLRGSRAVNQLTLFSPLPKLGQLSGCDVS